MATGRSFAEFVKNKCYDGLYQAANDFVDSDWQSLNLHTRHVHRIGKVEFVDATIQRVYVHDLPGMRVGFDVGLELEIEVKEGDYHYDESDTCYPWIRISCEGDLACGLDDWEITSVAPYNQRILRLTRFPMRLYRIFLLTGWRMKPQRSSRSSIPRR